MKIMHLRLAAISICILSLYSCGNSSASEETREKVKAETTQTAMKQNHDEVEIETLQSAKNEPTQTSPTKPNFKKLTVVKGEIATPDPLPPVEDSMHPPTYRFRSTGNQLDARSFDLCLEGFASSECYEDRRSASCPVGISSIIESDDFLEITLGTSSNCCYGFVGDIGVLNDSTLNLIYHDYGNNHCACNCGFVLTYTLRKECLVSSENRIELLKAFAINGDASSTVLLRR